MTTTKHVLSVSPFFQDWTTPGQITVNDDWGGVPSIVGYLGQNITTSTGTNPQTLTTDSTLPNDVDVIANQTDPNTLINGGVAEFDTLTDPVVALQGSGTADAPHLIIYLDATGEENIVFSFRARDIDGSGDNAIMQVAVQYRVGGTGAWIDIPAGYISDATTGPSILGPDTTRTVTLPAGANGASDLQIRVITTNAVGNDEWVGIDDISVTSDPIPPGPGNLAIVDAGVAEGNGPGTTPITFTVNRASGDDGAVTVDYAVTFTGTAPASAGDFAAGQVFTGTLSWADGDAAAKTITLNVQGDVTVEPNETFTVTLSNATGGASISDATATGTITNDDSGPVAIYEIQGATHISPWVGQVVTTTGIVTAVDSNGFYMQDPTGDANDATSEGIFVFTSSAPPASAVAGNAVTVTGTVAEFSANANSLSITEIISPSSIIVNSTGNALPAATLIGTGGRTPPTENYENDNFTSFDPATDALDFYESMEGMRVTVHAPLVVANTNSFGETWVVASGGVGATGLNDRDGITLTSADFNPERIQIDDDANLGPSYNPDHSQGDILSDVTGILNYAFVNYEVLVTGTVTTTTDVTLALETSTLTGDADHLTVASYNVENLDPTDPQSSFDDIADQIVFNLNAPDIIGLQEVQDADGAGSGSNYSGAVTAQMLIDAIVAAGGPTYQYVEIAPTSNSTSNGEPNGNIRNGYLYNPARVTYVAGSEELVLGAVASGARYPLAVDFLFNGETVTVINNHFTSRGGSDGLMGDNQPPSNAGDAARLVQALAVRDYIDDRLAVDSRLNVITLGDFNSYYFEAPLQAIQAGGVMVNLFDLLPVVERYSYMFEGNLQPFDNILVASLLAPGSTFDAVHLNAEQGGDGPTDHDQALARILIGIDELLNGTAGADTIDGRSGNDTINGLDGNDALLGGNGNDLLYGGAGNDHLSGGTGNDWYFVDQAGDLVTELTGAGNDRVFASVSYSLTGFAEVEMLTTAGNEGTDAIDLTGSDTANFIYGNDGVNVLTGYGGNDFLAARAGNDILDGGTGDDIMAGETGDDWYYVDSAGDLAFELAGQGTLDRVFASVSYALALTSEVELLTTAGNEGTEAINLTGSDTANFIYGNDGVNTLLGLGGNDFLASRAGNDVLDGGVGDDIMAGETGDDWYYVDSAGDLVVELAGAGNDRVLASVSHALAAGAEVELLSTTDSGGTAAINLTGSDTANFIYANNGANTLSGGGGNDFLVGLGGNDTLDGGTGADITDGGTGDDFHYVDSAGDSVVERAGEGNDRVLASVSYALAASAEVETLSTTDSAGTAAIDLTGSDTANSIEANDGANTLLGLGGSDSLVGLGGNDVLDGGTGNDTLQGGAGADSFRFTTALGSGNVDTILDFFGVGADGDDIIQLDDAVFAGLALGALNPDAFVIGTAAQDGDDRIIYDSATGNLYFDADGNGAGAAVQFATLDGVPALSSGDFTVI